MWYVRECSDDVENGVKKMLRIWVDDPKVVEMKVTKRRVIMELIILENSLYIFQLNYTHEKH